ncbi:MAG: hypothetical protein M1837_004755 [Sclerophora amabilis]|nr:MAG: hypothetical protein M1837_004755 [Sclerophora amabilis]
MSLVPSNRYWVVPDAWVTTFLQWFVGICSAHRVDLVFNRRVYLARVFNLADFGFPVGENQPYDSVEVQVFVPVGTSYHSVEAAASILIKGEEGSYGDHAPVGFDRRSSRAQNQQWRREEAWGLYGAEKWEDDPGFISWALEIRALRPSRLVSGAPADRDPSLRDPGRPLIELVISTRGSDQHISDDADVPLPDEDEAFHDPDTSLSDEDESFQDPEPLPSDRDEPPTINPNRILTVGNIPPPTGTEPRRAMGYPVALSTDPRVAMGYPVLNAPNAFPARYTLPSGGERHDNVLPLEYQPPRRRRRVRWIEKALTCQPWQRSWQSRRGGGGGGPEVERTPSSDRRSNSGYSDLPWIVER